MSQHYQQHYIDPTPVWVQPDSASPEAVPPQPSGSPLPQQVPYHGISTASGSAPTTPDWEKGRRRLNIVWSIAMAVVVVVAVVAGSIGGTVAVKSARDSCTATAGPNGNGAGPTTTSSSPGTQPSSSSTGTYTADPSSFSLPLAPTAVKQLATPPLPCPTGIIVGTYNSSASFKTYCQQSFDWTNLAAFIAYDFADCVDACLSMNRLQGGADVCIAVSMAFNLESWIFRSADADHGNCYLKGRPLSSLVSLQNAWAAALCKDPKCADWYQAGAS